MDFARKQLEKYGWTDGKGLGKKENGISEALKPKLKRSVTGVGHDPASEFNEHWWTTLYDKAANNVQVKDCNGTTKKIKTKDDFTITNNIWKMKRNLNNENNKQYSDCFVRTAVMNGGSSTENVRDTESGEEVESKEVLRMTDEELFAACGGRTAHKGARHGLRASGKLARIAKQEELLLSEAKYNGYSQAKKRNQNPEDVVEEVTFKTEVMTKRKCKKVKKKRNHCLSSEERSYEFGEAGIEDLSPTEKSVKKDVDSVLQFDGIPKDNNCNDTKDFLQDSKKERKRKSIKSIEHTISMDIDNIVEKKADVSNVKCNKKKKMKKK